MIAAPRLPIRRACHANRRRRRGAIPQTDRCAQISPQEEKPNPVARALRVGGTFTLRGMSSVDVELPQ